MAKMFFNKEISLQDLEKGVEFEVDDDAGNASDDDGFNDVTFDKNTDIIAEDDTSIKLRYLCDENIAFSELKKKMQPITEDGLVLKEVVKCGVGAVMSHRAVVFVHYDAYLEDRKEPFDSTRLRGKPFKFLLGDGKLIPGLDLGIQTMKKDEFSRILVSPAYAFGEMGCPPRIPPNSEILYEVQILNFFVGKDAIEFEEMSPEEQKRAPFEKIVGIYQCEHQLANDFFHKKLYKQAIARYRHVANLLAEVSVADEKDDDQRKGYLLKLYLNLSQCYLNLRIPHKALIYADLALKIDPDNLKGLYRMGTALHLTGSYDKAEYYLGRAKQHKPYENSINACIRKLEQKRKAYNDWEKMFCRRMLGGDQVKWKPDQFEEPPEFIQLIDDEIKEFLKSDDSELSFPPSYTESQLEVVKFISQSYDLAFVSKIQCGEKINKIAKRVPS